MKSPYLLEIEEMVIRKELVLLASKLKIAERFKKQEVVEALSTRANEFMLKLRDNFNKQNG